MPLIPNLIECLVLLRLNQGPELRVVLAAPEAA